MAVKYFRDNVIQSAATKPYNTKARKNYTHDLPTRSYDHNLQMWRHKKARRKASLYRDL